jgi:hypothetical protein
MVRLHDPPVGRDGHSRNGSFSVWANVGFAVHAVNICVANSLDDIFLNISVDRLGGALAALEAEY